MTVVKVALITNVHEYAGPGAVDALLKAGMTVVGHDRRFADPAARKAFVAERTGLFASAEGNAAELAAQTLADRGRIDALISNDIIPDPVRPIEGSTADDFRSVLEAGTIFPYCLAHAVIPQMREQRSGSIVFVTSSTALHPMGITAIYGAARAATTAYAIALAQALGPDNIQVNAVGPVFFENPTYFPDGWESMMPDLKTKLDTEVPLRRLGTQNEMGSLITLLASQSAMPITGQFINFSAGLYH